MEWITSLQKAINYIEEHILEDINYEDAARQVYISSYEFHRAFSFLTGMTANVIAPPFLSSMSINEVTAVRESANTKPSINGGKRTPTTAAIMDTIT